MVSGANSSELVDVVVVVSILLFAFLWLVSAALKIDCCEKYRHWTFLLLLLWNCGMDVAEEGMTLWRWPSWCCCCGFNAVRAALRMITLLVGNIFFVLEVCCFKFHREAILFLCGCISATTIFCKRRSTNLFSAWQNTGKARTTASNTNFFYSDDAICSSISI